MYIWQITIEDYLEAVELAKQRGKQVGESIEVEFLEIMKKKRKKYKCQTNKSLPEIKQVFKDKGFNVLTIDNLKGEKNDSR